MKKTNLVLGMMIMLFAMSGNLFSQNNCLDFDGTYDYVDCGNDASLNITDAITIEAWVKPSQLLSYDNIVTKDLADGNRNYHLTTDVDELAFVFTGGSVHTTTNANLAINNWYHLVITFSATDNLVKIYVNGIAKTLNTGGTESGTPSTNTGHLQIGHNYWDSNNLYLFKGTIDEVRIWDVARTETEIIDNMHKHLTGYEDGLVAYYQFNEESGSTILPDLTPNKNHGTLMNMNPSEDWVLSDAVVGTFSAGYQCSVRALWKATGTNWTGSSDGLQMKSAPAISLITNFVIFGNNCISGTSTSDLPSGVDIRAARIWYFIKCGTVTPDIHIYLSSAGASDVYVSNLPISHYKLLRRDGTSGTFSIVTFGSSISDNEITFDGVSISSGYYTIGRENATVGFTNGSSYTPSITPGQDNQPVGRFKLTGAQLGASLTAATIKLNGTRTGTSNIKLWESADDIFVIGSDGATLLDGPYSDPGAGNLVSFSGFTSSVSTDGMYYFITCDVASNATGSIQAVLVNNSSLTLSGGNLSGTIDNAALSTGESPLPVELSSFTANSLKGSVILNWTTASEINNAGFDVERQSLSSRKDTWTKIGFVEGNGTTNETKNYTFIDRKLKTGKYNYRLVQRDYNNRGVEHFLSDVVTVGVPKKYTISQNYPNPFNPNTKIDYELPYDGKVNIKLYDVIGREVATIVNEVHSAGYYTAEYNASSLASGIYFYRIIAKGGESDFIMTKKMVLIK